MTYGNPTRPTAIDYYRTGLLASALAYVGILLLIVVSLLIGNGDAQMAFTMFFMGGLYAAIPAVGIALLITAPLGCLFGIAMREWFEPGHWHGAVNGAATAITLLTGSALLLEGEIREVPDPGTLLFFAGIVAIGAGSGWIAQRKALGWPNEFEEIDCEVFE